LLTVLLLSGRSSIKIAAILILVVASLVVWSLGVEQINGLLFKSQAVDTLEKRTEIWSRALYMIQDFPFTGIGMGTFQPIATMLYPFFLADPNAQIPHAHNLFLQVAVDLGIPGLIAWLAILMLVIIAAWQVYRHGTATGNQWLAGLGAGLLCSQVALIVHGLTDAVTWGTRPAIIVWAIWGLAMAARNQIPPNDL
jgi:putative inorganic carbon (HCO3(-)) transporter